MNNKVMEGDLRVWCVINPPRPLTYYPVNDWQHAKRLITALAESQLLMPQIESNAFGLEVWEDGEWLEWQSADGRDIDELIKSGDEP